MPLQATSGAASYDAFGGGVAAVPNYIEDVFSTYLYTGTGANQSIVNNIDLSTNKGMVWIKDKTYASDHYITGNGSNFNSYVSSNLTSPEYSGTSYFSPRTDGFNLLGAGGGYVNTDGDKYVSWTFRNQPKFFQALTYTGDGTSNRPVAHSLASVPGCIIIKSTGTTTNWMVWHRSLSTDNLLVLNATTAQQNYATVTIHDVTSTNFQVDNYSMLNASGVQYVAYVFAHNAGGFGLTGTDNVISCGSYTGNGTSGVAVTLGYEPQWLMIKRTDSTGNWTMIDTMRGFPVGSNDSAFWANTTNAELSGQAGNPTATGFYLDGSWSDVNTPDGRYIYIAIRRGPMKVPTDGTKVFSPIARTGTGSATTIGSTGFPVDSIMYTLRSGGLGTSWQDRLRGPSAWFQTFDTAAEGTVTTQVTSFANQDSVNIGAGSYINFNGYTYINYAMRRAPGFFDEVCYTGNNTIRTINHNLGVVPEMIIVKTRSGTTGWPVYHQAMGNTRYAFLDLNVAQQGPLSDIWNSTTPTSSVFSLGNNSQTNAADTYVAYLFATCAGVSKVGSYTGTGTTQQINCGFTAGSRFVLIKRTDASGDWYVWDSARGIVAGNDPYLLLNSTVAEVTSTDYVDTYSAGFEISSTAPAAINASGGTFIFFAVA